MNSHNTAADDARGAQFAARATFGVTAPGALLDVVTQQGSVDQTQAAAAIDDGAVYVDGRRCRDRTAQLRIGQQIVVQPPAPAARREIGGGRLAIVYRDKRLVVVDKPAGLPTQPPPRGGDALSLRVAKLPSAKAYLGEVHRLDRDASGLVVYALDKACATHLAAQFRDHSAHRRYLAVVRSLVRPEDQIIDEPIAQLGPGQMVTAAYGVPATTQVRTLGFDATTGLALVDLQLRTGRSHQIRVHLAWAVGPICGDRQYGDRQYGDRQYGKERAGEVRAGDAGQQEARTMSEGIGPRIALHGGFLALQHPELGPMQWTAAPPPGFWPQHAQPALQVPDTWPQR